VNDRERQADRQDALEGGCDGRDWARIRWDVRVFGSVGSTNDVARRLADAGAPEGTVVLAERQTCGRGRRGGVWESPAGGLWFSFILRPHLPAARAAGLAVVGSIAVARAAESASGVRARIKWPNDVHVGGRKLAGVMVEGIGGGALVLGVGLNVNIPPGELPWFRWYRTTSLMAETGCRFMRGELLASFAREFEPRYFRYRGPDHEEFLREWRSLSLVCGEEVEVTWEGRTLRGAVHGLEDDGGIVLRLHDGRQQKVPAMGDVTLAVIRDGLFS